MQFNVTAKELEETNALLNDLYKWRSLRSIGDHYSQGEVVLKMKVGNQIISIGHSVDGYGIAHHKARNPVEICNLNIETMLSSYATKMANEACDIILKSMPIPVVEWE